MKVIIMGDGIVSNAPYIRLLERQRMKYLLGEKPGDHQFLFDAIDEAQEAEYHEFTTDFIFRCFIHKIKNSFFSYRFVIPNFNA